MKANILREIVKESLRPGVISLAGGMPAEDLFDIEGLRAAASAAMDRAPEQALQYGGSEGSVALRRRISSLMAEGGLEGVDEDSVVVTTGASQGIDLISRVLLDPEDVMAVERPTFLATLNAAELCEAEIVEVSMDSGGLDLEALEACFKRASVKVLYTMPTFSNPSGALLSESRRRGLLELAKEHDVIVVEDDAYGMLWFEREPPPCLLSIARQLDDPPTCVYVSSFSKIMAPGMRLGWLIAPPSIVERVSVVKQIADVHTSSLDQAIAVEYLKEGRLAANLERARGAYAERSRWLADAIHQGLPAGVLEFTPPTGGMFLWSRLHGHSAVRLAERALANGVTIVPGDPFFASPPADQHIRLSYSMVNEETAIKAVERLAAAIAD